MMVSGFFGIIGLLLVIGLIAVAIMAVAGIVGRKSSASKIGITIAVMGFGMFFLLCMGGAFLFVFSESSSVSAPQEPPFDEQMAPKSDLPVARKEPFFPQQTVTPAQKKPVKKQAAKKTTATVKEDIKIKTTPQWIQKNETKQRGKKHLILHSGQFATTAEAEADLLKKVELQIKKQLHMSNEENASFRLEAYDNYCDIYGMQNGRHETMGTVSHLSHNRYRVRIYGNLYGMGFSKSNGTVILTVPRSAMPAHFNKTTWRIPKSILRQAIKKRFDETIQRSTENHKFKMHRLHGQVYISEKELAFAWRSIQKVVVQNEKNITKENVWISGILLGMLTLLLGTIATYLRVDTLTNGTYRNRLRFAGTAVVLLGTMVGVFLLKLVS